MLLQFMVITFEVSFSYSLYPSKPLVGADWLIPHAVMVFFTSSDIEYLTRTHELFYPGYGTVRESPIPTLSYTVLLTLSHKVVTVHTSNSLE